MNFLKENYDFKDENFRIMTDDAEDEKLIPTRENIINSMKWLTEGAKSGDSLLFHYSGKDNIYYINRIDCKRKMFLTKMYIFNIFFFSIINIGHGLSIEDKGKLIQTFICY